jgi:hypothetical protein
MRLTGRIFYGVAAALGLISLGMEWQNRQRVRQTRGMFSQFQAPQHNTGMLLALWAAIVGITGKVIEDTSEREPMTAGIPGRQFGASLGSYREYLPKPPQRTKTLRSDFDLGDQYVEPRANSQAFATVH